MELSSSNSQREVGVFVQSTITTAVSMTITDHERNYENLRQ